MHARAAADQAAARIKTAKAGVEAAKAKQDAAKATKEEMVSLYGYREKQKTRMEQLVKSNVIDQRLMDEEIEHFHAAEASVHSADAGILTALAQFIEAEAMVEQAKADFEAAKAQVNVSEANVEKAKVFVQYTRIISPYDGFVIDRGDGVHPGAFIQAATGGAAQPLLTVAETAKMRTIVLVPDRDVPYCDVGDPATVVLDSLGGRSFPGTVSRVAESEDLKDRTMRVEIDLPNPNHVLRDGMFGRATIVLEQQTPHMTLPSSCLIERNGKGEGAVLVVRDHKVHRANVRVGRDDGLRAEIIDGLSIDEQVINQPDASIAEGTEVHAESLETPDLSAKSAKAAHS